MIDWSLKKLVTHAFVTGHPRFAQDLEFFEGKNEQTWINHPGVDNDVDDKCQLPMIKAIAPRKKKNAWNPQKTRCEKKKLNYLPKPSSTRSCPSPLAKVDNSYSPSFATQPQKVPARFQDCSGFLGACIFVSPVPGRRD